MNPSDPDSFVSCTTYAPWPQSGFSINMTLDENHNPLSDGTLVIRGYIPAVQGCIPGETDPEEYHAEYYDLANDSILLTGNIAQFGYDDVLHYDDKGKPYYNDSLEFIFDVTGGVLHDTYSYFPGQIGVAMYWTGFDDSFDPEGNPFVNDFSTETSVSDAFLIPIPEPTSMFLLLTSMGSLLLISMLRRFR